MKIVASALIALSVLASVAAPAGAFDAKSLFQQLDRRVGRRELTSPSPERGGVSHRALLNRDGGPHEDAKECCCPAAQDTC